MSNASPCHCSGNSYVIILVLYILLVIILGSVMFC